MLHVPDVRATISWYESVGFTLEGTNECDGVLDWALLAFGEGRVMFNAGGQRTDQQRREVDLYLEVEQIEAVYASLRGRVELQQELHDTFYGTREFIVRDPNGFWVTFGEPLAPAPG